MFNGGNVKCVQQPANPMYLGIEGPGTMSIEEVYDAYASLLFGYILKIIEHKDEAEAILISVFVNYSQNRERYYESNGLLFISLLNRARNEAIDGLIKGYRGKLTGKPPAGNETTHPLIQDLPLFEKTILALIHLKGFSVNEVADFLQVPVKIILNKMGAYASAANPAYW